MNFPRTGDLHRRAGRVEFALHSQHETSRDSEIQTEEDFKGKSGERLRSLSTVSWNSHDWYEY